MKHLGLILCGAIFVGCSADPNDTTALEPTSAAGEDADGESDEAISGKVHYAPKALNVFWERGCGVPMPHGQACAQGLFVTFTRKYADLHVTKTVTVDNAHQTVTIKLDTWSQGKTHPVKSVQPQTEELDVRGVNHSVEYTVRVVNWKGTQLWSDKMTMMFAM